MRCDDVDPQPAAEAGRSALLDLRTDAACRGMPTALFFPARGEGGVMTAARARAVCAGCPVRVGCLAHALDALEWTGVWGATTEKERRPLSRRVKAGESVHAVAADHLGSPGPSSAQAVA